MKAIKYMNPWEVKCAEVQMPVRKENEALIKVKNAGICGSDIGAFRGTNPLVTYPRIIGHEVVGEIIEIPLKNKKNLKVGDKVILDPYLYCGKCYPCSIGRTNCCENLQVLGVHVDGAMAEYVTHPADMLWKLPEDIELELAPIAEPLTIALHGIHRGRLERGEHVVIIGAGTIGLLAAMAALSYGAIPIVIDVVEERLEKAKKIEGVFVINSVVENVECKVMEYTRGKKAELVMECSGANDAIHSSLNYVSNAGRITLTGWPHKETPIPTNLITEKEIDIRGSRTSANEFEEAIRLIHQKIVDVKQILTCTIPMEDVPKMIRQIEKEPGKYLKVNVCM